MSDKSPNLPRVLGAQVGIRDFECAKIWKRRLKFSLNSPAQQSDDIFFASLHSIPFEHLILTLNQRTLRKSCQSRFETRN